MASLPILVRPEGRQSVIVVGAGPAGLTAAYRLSAGGCRVTLLSASSMPGQQWRASAFSPILGCHHATWALLSALGFPRNPSLFVESTLEFLLPQGRLARYPRSLLPSPLHQLLTIGRFAGLPLAERWKLLWWLEQLWEGSLNLPADLEQRTARNWVESLDWSRASVESIWSPLVAWLTGNDLRTMSADAFVTALTPFFLSRGPDNRVWLCGQPLERLLAEPIIAQLAKNGATVAVQSHAVRFEYQDDRTSGVRLRDGTILHADWYVSAVPSSQLTPLLPERWLTRYAYFQHIADLTILPYSSIDVRTTAAPTSPRQILLGSGAFRWLVSMPSSAGGQFAGKLFLPSGGAPDVDEHEVSLLLRSLRLLNPGDRLMECTRQQARCAALSLSPGTKVLRPIQRSPIRNLLVAGAWTDTGWPANLESAIVSAERCAEIVLTRAVLQQ